MKTRIGLLLLFCIATSGCKKDKDLPTPMPRPVWEVMGTEKYPVSMTAVVRLPDNLVAKQQTTDQIGAFVRGECRGLGVPVEVGGSILYFVLVHGTSTETEEVGFQYYGTQNSRLYKTGAFLAFKVDGIWGTVDSPKTLDLK